MRAETEIMDVLRDHEGKTAALLSDAEALDIRAREMGWSADRLRGFAEGVSWAYRWCLEGAPVPTAAAIIKRLSDVALRLHANDWAYLRDGVAALGAELRVQRGIIIRAEVELKKAIEAKENWRTRYQARLEKPHRHR